jgi:hypothetical protein
MCILKYVMFAGKQELKGQIHIKFKRLIKEFRSCSVQVETTPNGGKDQGATMKHSRGPRRKDQLYTTRPPNLVAEIMTPESHLQRGKKKELQEDPRGGRPGRTRPRWAQASRPNSFLHRFRAPFLQHQVYETLNAYRRCHSPRSPIDTSMVDHKKRAAMR